MCSVPFVTAAAPQFGSHQWKCSCYPQGAVKAFLFCHFIGNGKAISYTGDIWHTWIWIGTYTITVKGSGVLGFAQKNGTQYTCFMKTVRGGNKILKALITQLFGHVPLHFY